jgi:hypothetical protein
MKLSALGIAVLLWFSIRFEARNQQEIANVAVRVDLTDPEWAVAGGSDPGTVTVRFRGPALELLRLSADRPSIVVPVTDVVGGDTTLVLQPGWVRFGERPGVSVEGISPGSVRLSFESIQRITLPAALRFTGALPEDVALVAPPVPTVREFRVSGPRSRTGVLDSIPLVALDLSSVTQSGVLPALVDTARISGVQVQPIALEIEFRVEPRVAREVSVPAPLLPEAYRGEGYPEALIVHLDGARSLVEGVNPAALRILLELVEDLDPEWERHEVGFRVEGLPALVRARIDPVEVLREEP